MADENYPKQCNKKFLKSLYDTRLEIHENMARLIRNLNDEKDELWKVEHAIAELELELDKSFD
ncbi:hypothetical protein [Sporosarcina sp. FSL W7-1283]|uniref:hypothetical protein n=1 Tax=Sporosarcina sp. FSL W7-1283 TaxID=2921560 RepID=UPI0030FC3A48